MTSSLETLGQNPIRQNGVFTVRILLAGILAMLLLAPAASAKEVVAYFGTEAGAGSFGGQFQNPGDVAVNSTGAGPASIGEIYVLDRGNQRIQRFSQEDNGTPTDPYDDSYPFVSAWGADVDGSTAGGSIYEVCVVAESCKAAVASGGSGALQSPSAIAVDQDNGDVYVADSGNNRVNVYAGDGTFLRAFGVDVVASGPGDTGTGFEICVAANGDVCKSGAAGSSLGQLSHAEGIALSPSDGDPASGTVFVADQGNKRVNTYELSGASPASFGSASDFGSSGPYSGPFDLAVDARGIVYVEAGDQPDKWIIARYDSRSANGGGVGFLSPIPIPPLLTQGGSQVNAGLEVDPDVDGPGVATDILYALRGVGSDSFSIVQQFGPLNSPGLTAPPAAADASHGSVAGINFALGLGFDASSGRLFVTSNAEVNGEAPKSGVYVLDVAGGAASASLDSISDITADSVRVHATVDPNGPPAVGYQLEYSINGSDWTEEPEVVVGSQEIPQSIETTLSPVGTGLQPNTLYHVRLSVEKAFTPPITTSELTFTTLAEAPQVETTGSPVRTTTSAQLGGRVGPRNKATTYHFEYGDEGPCDAHPCQSTAVVAVGSGAVQRLVSTKIDGLKPDTTYHYRVVADNGASGSPSFGSDMTVTTRASDAPLSHGQFPGPPGSDRAYELVSVPDSGGNPVFETQGISTDGNRAVYSIAGGTPISDTGSLFSFYFAERTATGWETRNISPRRQELVGATWSIGRRADDLSFLNMRNVSDTNDNTFWRLSTEGPAQRVFDFSPPTELTPAESVIFDSATDGTRTVAQLVGGSLDPDHPAAATTANIYDISSGTARLISLLPGDVVPACGSGSGLQSFASAVSLSRDGRQLIFPSQGNGACGTLGGSPSRLYIRDLETGSTDLITPAPLSGLECGSGAALRLTPTSFYFWTQDRLSAEDTAPASCGGAKPLDGDVYRYDLDAASLECVTCVIPDRDLDVEASLAPNGGRGQIAVSEDGSRIYFRSASSTPLLPGALAGEESTYVLEVGSSQLRWLGAGVAFGQTPRRMTSDGSVVIFDSKSPSLNPLGGTSDNGGETQLYRYDDTDRSLVCLSCPQDGSATAARFDTDSGVSADGSAIGFSTSTGLVSGDQNAPGGDQNPSRGADVYEWRDGRLFLITDGLTDWSPGADPKAVGISRSGRDLFFTAFAQYTPDAIDAYNRLYDARIGGGFEYPKPPPPCPLEVCQGIPKGAPEEQAPSTATLLGAGNKPSAQRHRARCAKGSRKVRRAGKTRCVKAKRTPRQRPDKHDRRAAQ